MHDFVNDMVVGTWLAFGKEGKTTNARLSWVSPLRSKYIFTSRARTKAIVVTPEELAWQLGAGKASLVVEPVPLFDRAVSAALDSLAAKAHGAAAGLSARRGPHASLKLAVRRSCARQTGEQKATALGPMPLGAHCLLSIAGVPSDRRVWRRFASLRLSKKR